MKMKTTSRDVSILKFLWKFRAAPTKAIAVRYFNNEHLSSKSCYNRLLRLSKAGYIQSNYDTRDGQKHVWILTRQGFKAVRECLRDYYTIKAEYFLPEKTGHDVFVSGMHIGPWLKERPLNLEFVTQTQLKSIVDYQLADEIPKTDLKIPDGYWVIGEDGTHRRVIALEVELNAKRNEDYLYTASFYRSCKEIEYVIWVARNMYVVNQIWRTFKDCQPGSLGKHCFVLADDVLKLGWEARILSGDLKDKKLSEVLPIPKKSTSGEPSSKAHEGDGNCPLPVTALSYFELQKSGIISSPSLFYKVGDFT